MIQLVKRSKRRQHFKALSKSKMKKKIAEEISMFSNLHILSVFKKILTQ